MFYIHVGLIIDGIHEKNLLVLALSLDILYVVSPSRPLPSLFKLCPAGHLNIHLNREKHETIFLSETIKPRPLIFGTCM